MIWDIPPGKLRRIRDELRARRGTSEPEPHGVLRAKLKGHANRVLSIAFCPDGKTVASASADHLIKIWDVGTGEERLTLKGHSNRVNSITFMPDGKTLVSGSQDTVGRDVRTCCEGDRGRWRTASERAPAGGVRHEGTVITAACVTVPIRTRPRGEPVKNFGPFLHRDPQTTARLILRGFCSGVNSPLKKGGRGSC